MKNQQYLSHLQEEFERLAYSYGIQPAICTLLGEYLSETFSHIWNNGRLYERAGKQIRERPVFSGNHSARLSPA